MPHDMLRRIYQATMADQQPAGAAAAAPDAAAGGGEESLLSHLRTLSTTSATDLRQQVGGPAGVVETLAGLASSSFGKQGAGAPPFPVVPASASSAPAPAGAADAGAGAGAGGRAQGASVAAASPQRQEECLLYLQTLTVHSSNLVGCIDSGIKLEAVATCVKVCDIVLIVCFAEYVHVAMSWPYPDEQYTKCVRVPCCLPLFLWPSARVDLLRHLVMFMSQCTTTPVMAPLRLKFHCLLYDFCLHSFIHSFIPVPTGRGDGRYVPSGAPSRYRSIGNHPGSGGYCHGLSASCGARSGQ